MKETETQTLWMQDGWLAEKENENENVDEDGSETRAEDIHEPAGNIEPDNATFICRNCGGAQPLFWPRTGQAEGLLAKPLPLQEVFHAP